MNSYPSLLTISLGYLYVYYRVDNINGVTYEQNRANLQRLYEAELINTYAITGSQESYLFMTNQNGEEVLLDKP